MDENILDLVENPLGSLPADATASQALDFLLFLHLYDVEADRAHWEYSGASSEQLHHKLVAFRERLENSKFYQAMGDAARALQATVKAQTSYRSVPQSGIDQTADWQTDTGRPADWAGCQTGGHCSRPGHTPDRQTSERGARP